MSCSVSNLCAAHGTRRTGEASNTGVAASRHGAWQNAMEQAQMEGWFSSSLSADASKEPAPEQPKSSRRIGPVVFPMRSATNAMNSERLELLRGAPVMPAHGQPVVRQLLPAAEYPSAQLPNAEDVLVLEPPACESDRTSADAGADTGPDAVSSRQGEIQTLGAYRPAVHPVDTYIYASLAKAVGQPATLLAESSSSSSPASAGLTNRAQPLPPVSASISLTLANDSPVELEPRGNAGNSVDKETARPEVRRIVSPDVQSNYQSNDEPESPLRVHVDWSHEGARIWLGLNQERAMSVGGMGRHLDQWLAASGVKLAAVVCNGRTIYSRYPIRSFE